MSIKSTKSKVLCLVQARMGAERLPGKVLLPARGMPLLEHELRRVEQAKIIDKIVVATTIHTQDEQIEKLCKRLKITCFRGSQQDVLDRYYQASLLYPRHEIIVRITGDCPLIDPKVVSETVTLFRKNRLDYASNVGSAPETFPDGTDVEVFSRAALTDAWRSARLPSEREHVTPYIRRNRKLKKGWLSAPYDFSHIRLTLDEPQDYAAIKFLIEKMGRGSLSASYMDYVALITKHPEVMMKNMHIVRNEGYAKSLMQDAASTK